jgi:long-chain acyl-CoA synthetase
VTAENILQELTGPGQICEIEHIEVNGALVKNWKHAPPSMAAIAESSRNHGEREYIVYGDERLTFEEHYRQVAALAHTLATKFGVKKGDRVAIAMRNYPEWSIAFWATVSIGAIVVPLNAWWTSGELEYGLRDSGSRVVFVDQERLARLQQISEPLPLEHTVAVRCDGLPVDVIDLHTCVREVDTTATLPEVDIDPDDDATIFYTSGTTGFPKGTLGTHRNFCSVAGTFAFNGAQTLLKMGGKIEDLPLLQHFPQAALLTVPLFHVTGCLGIMLPMFLGGGKLVMLHKWDPRAALDAIEKEKITMLTGVPAMIGQLIQEPDFTERDVSSLLTLAYGGAPAPPELLRNIKARAPSVMVVNGWGITETSSAICGISGEDYARKPDSVGAPMPVCEVKVVNEAGEELPRGEMGEFWVRGPNVTRGYWNKPEATEASYVDGWFRSGDVGKIDDEGFVYVLDRLKDMVIRGGENVYCAEVEAALVEHPEVAAACVFGIPDEALGEQVAAVVVVSPDAGVSEQELRDVAAIRLAAFKVPGRIWFREDPLPLGVTGKVNKRDIRKQYLALQVNGGA